jgi:type I restriction enzyme, S subunit
MEVKAGYKQTEIGIFPNDWVIVPLKNVSSMHGRIGWQGLKQSEFTMNPDQPFLITGMNFKDGEIRWDEVYHISNERYELAKEIQLRTGDVLMTKDGTIGKILYVDIIPFPGKASLNSHLLVFRPINKKYVPKFFYYQLQSKTFLSHIDLEKSGQPFLALLRKQLVNTMLSYRPFLNKKQSPKP